MQPLPGWQSEFSPHFVVIDARTVACLMVNLESVLCGLSIFTREKR